MHARIGMPVDSTDGPWGELDDFIVDPTNWHLTHLVVQPHHHHSRSHLVPITSVNACDEKLRLALSADDIDTSPQFETTEFVKLNRTHAFKNDWTTDTTSVSAWPYYPFAGMALDPAAAGYIYSHDIANPSGPRYVATTFDHVPNDEVQIRRSSHVTSTDEHTIGSVDGFVFDKDGQITHLVLEHGHLWGHRNVTIPISHVQRATRDVVRLNVTRDAIGEYPSVRFERHAR